MKIFLVFMTIPLLWSCSKRDVIQTHAIEILKDDDLSFVNDADVLKIDARNTIAFESSHLRGSVNITLQDVRSDPKRVASILDKWRGRKMVIYCYGKGCDSSMGVAQYLIYCGHQICVYNEGWNTIKNVIDN